MSDTRQHRWDILQATATGLNHWTARPPRPNQDAMGVRRYGPDDSTLLISVADGHGSKAYTHSEIGSRLAVSAFEDSVDILVRNIDRPLVATKGDAETATCRQIARQWRALVATDAATRPGGPPVSAYGTTLLGVMVHGDLFVSWQVGDGDILFVFDDGVVEGVLAPESVQLGSETDSLCSPTAELDFRFAWSLRRTNRPRLVMLASDGLSNSFVDRAAFERFGAGMLQRLRADGVDAVRDRLPHWLHVAARHSGDDVTLVCAYADPDSTSGSAAS